MVSTTKMVVLGAACLIGQCQPFTPCALSAVHRQKHIVLSAASSAPSIVDVITERHYESRRSFLASSFAGTFGIVTPFVRPNTVIASEGKLQSILGQIKEGREQLECVPELIKAEKWDGVRAVLTKPPLSSMWTSKGQNKLLDDYAESIGNELPNGDEIAALELREDILSHLRYLDMAVYNNVFNPIASEGKTGATKELVRSYYEDPINEWKASVSAIDELIALASP